MSGCLWGGRLCRYRRPPALCYVDKCFPWPSVKGQAPTEARAKGFKLPRASAEPVALVNMLRKARWQAGQQSPALCSRMSYGDMGVCSPPPGLKACTAMWQPAQGTVLPGGWAESSTPLSWEQWSCEGYTQSRWQTHSQHQKCADEQNANYEKGKFSSHT